MVRKKGFSMVEAVVSLFLIIIAAFVLLKVFPASRKGLQLSENHVNAAYIGRGLLDDVRRKGFDAAVPSSGTVDYKGLDNGAPFSQSFNYSVNVQADGTTKKFVWVDMTWKEATGSKKITLETIIIKP